MNSFKTHLQEHGITYHQHRKLAWFFAGRSFRVACMAFVHGIAPNAFVKFGASDLHKTIMPDYLDRLEKMKDEDA